MAEKRGPKKGSAEVSLRNNPERQAIFLRALEETGNFAEACRVASPHSESGALSTFKNFLRADPEFAAKVQERLEHFRASLVKAAVTRGRDGYDRPIFQRGELVGTEKIYSDSLLLAELKKHYPESYAERHQHQHQVTVQKSGAWEITTEDLAHLSADEKTQLAQLMDRVRDGRRERLALEDHTEDAEFEVVR